MVAVRGTRADGNACVPDALVRGASAVITDRPDLPLYQSVTCPVIAARDSRQVPGPLAANFYDHPAKGMTVVGVTIRGVHGLSAGFIGSLGIRYRDKVFASRAPRSIRRPPVIPRVSGF